MNINKALGTIRFTPLGIHTKKTASDEFIIAYIANGKGSYIKVSHVPQTRTAYLAKGYTDPSHRRLGIATALRAYAMWVLYLSGYKTVHHWGVNVENLVNPSKNYPISTSIVRKHLGFVKPNRTKEPNKPRKNYLVYNSVWTPSANALRKLTGTISNSIKKLSAIKNRNLTFSGNVSNYIKNNNNGPPKNKIKN